MDQWFAVGHCPGRGREVDLLPSIVGEWEGFDPLHSRVVAFRAVENGAAVVRQPQGARSVKVDGYGRILSGASGLTHQPTALGPNVDVSTMCAQLGDWLGCLSLAALLGPLGRTWFST